MNFSFKTRLNILFLSLGFLLQSLTILAIASWLGQHNENYIALGLTLFASTIFTAFLFFYLSGYLTDKLIHTQKRNKAKVSQKIFSREQFVKYLTKQLNTKTLAEMAIVTIAVDRFPQLNHALGYPITERLLQRIGERLVKAFNREQKIAELTNNIFVTVLPHVTSSNYVREIEKILELFDKSFSVYTVNIDVEALVGVSFYPIDGRDANSLIQKSDVALYQAKHKSERYAVYDDKNDPHRFNKISLMGELREGLVQNEFEVYYQPIIDLKTEQIVQVESLIRWRHPTQGFLLPQAFIPLAEETGHIKKLSMWILEQVFIQQSNWQNKNIHLRTSINLSVKDLLNKKFIPFGLTLLKKYQINPNSITFEVTESTFMHDPEKAMETIHRLTDIGFHLSIDDFGIEYSALSLLKKLHIHELKIDKSFLEEIIQEERISNLVESIIALGHSLNIKIVAEGIENIETYNLLKALNCDLGQGYLFSEPLRSEELIVWLQSSPWGL